MRIEGIKWLTGKERRYRRRWKKYRILAVRFHVPSMDRAELVRRAQIHALTRSDSIPNGSTTYRECVAYLQHELVVPSWKFVADTAYGKLYLRLCRKLYMSIGDAYPWLRGECQKQLGRRERQVAWRRKVRKEQRRLRKRLVLDPFATATIIFDENTPEFFRSVGSLDPSRFFYSGPFPKSAVIKARRFGEYPNDNWWEWGEDSEGLVLYSEKAKSQYSSIPNPRVIKKRLMGGFSG